MWSVDEVSGVVNFEIPDYSLDSISFVELDQETKGGEGS